MNLLVNLAGLLIAAFVVWWFWLWKPRQALVSAGRPIDILVDDGIYEPAYIETPKGQPLTLRFLRKDASPCAEQVIFHGLDISETLPIGKPKEIRFTPKQAGTFRFTCQMQMYQGQLKVTD
ncbi:cupredoxin domain-containing protein [Mangrovitalea sediminis]|uniref:cupredoxin domain-containing protein n=1 Tax=Mangrovitalea sediminis TaxID=1982043 RepID=UPI000BE4F566|nr:cupredoxin domain-containing protein [Mangrovitalea sediminis]